MEIASFGLTLIINLIILVIFFTKIKINVENLNKEINELKLKNEKMETKINDNINTVNILLTKFDLVNSNIVNTLNKMENNLTKLSEITDELKTASIVHSQCIYYKKNK
jgi:predicted RND superfamily exporter protein